MEGHGSIEIQVTDYWELTLPVNYNEVLKAIAATEQRWKEESNTYNTHPGPIEVVVSGDDKIRIQFRRDFNPARDT